MKKIISVVMLIMMLMCVTNVSAQWSVTPEAGMNVTKYKGGSPAQIGFKAGAAVNYTFGSGLFSLQSGLYYVQRGQGKTYSGTAYGKGMGEDGKMEDRYLYFSQGTLGYGGYGNMGSYGGLIGYGYWGYMGSSSSPFPQDMRVDGIQTSESSVRRDYLQLPVLGRFNWKVGEDVKLHVAAGPYLAYGIAGKSKYKSIDMSKDGYSAYSSSQSPFGKNSGLRRFDWGLTLNAGIEVKRFAFNATYDMGLGEGYKYEGVGLKYHTASFTVGYRF